MSVFQAADTVITPYVRGRFEHLCCHPQEQIDDTTAHVSRNRSYKKSGRCGKVHSSGKRILTQQK